MTPEQIKDVIVSTAEDIEAEELLEPYKEDLKGQEAIGLMISLIIESERARKAEEILKRFFNGISRVIKLIIESTPEGIERAMKAEELLKRHIEDLKGVRIRGGVTAIEYMKNRITENRKQASSYTSYVDTQRQQNPKQTSCDIS